MGTKAEMRIHSDIAWNIASKYSDVLASETRDLAAHIDIALKEKQDEIDKLNKQIAIQAEAINQYEEYIQQYKETGVIVF